MRNEKIKRLKRLFAVLLGLFILAQGIQAKNYKAAEIRTTVSYKYGRFETRMLASNKSGILSTLFTFNDDNFTVPQWNEIDIEQLGRYNDRVQFNVITLNHAMHEHNHYLSKNPSQCFITYAFEWAPTYVAFFIDGAEVYRDSAAYISELTFTQKFMLNHWATNLAAWAGAFDPASLPAYAFYDFAAYYAYTPGSGNYGTGNNFTLQWKDDFNTFNTGRWQAATHTFAENECDFIPQNAVIKDGYLVLAITDQYNTGFNGTIPADCGAAATNTPTGTATRTNTSVPPSATNTVTKTSTAVPPSPTYTATNTFTVTRTFTPINTNTAVPPTSTNSVVPTATITATGTYSSTQTFTSTRTNTALPPTATHSFTVTWTPSTVNSPTASYTLTPLPYTPTGTSTALLPTATNTATAVPATQSFTATHTQPAVSTETFTATFTLTFTRTGTQTYTATGTFTATNTRTYTATPAFTFTETQTQTFTPVFTETFTSTETPIIPTATATDTATPGPTVTATESDVFEFPPDKPVIVFPHPAKAGQDCWIQFNMTKKADSGTIKIYTYSYRAVRDIKIEERINAGVNTVRVKGIYTSEFGTGGYYYIITARSGSVEARTKIQKLVVLK